MKIHATNIKHLMVRDGVRQKDVARAIGVHPTAFSFALNSGNSTRDVAERLAVFFRVPFKEIAADSDDAILPEAIFDDDIVKRIEEIIDRKLDEKLAPLVDQMKILNKLIDLANNAINGGSGK